MGGSFNTREFFHASPLARLRAVKWAFLLLVFPLPLALLAAGATLASWPVLALAFALQYLGLLAERWFFFAQARHPQNLYYQAIS
jgi:DMSO reductase anchor subunit